MDLTSLAQLYETMRADLEHRLNEAKDHIENYERMRKEYTDTVERRAIEDKEYVNKLFLFLTSIEEESIKTIHDRMGTPKE